MNKITYKFYRSGKSKNKYAKHVLESDYIKTNIEVTVILASDFSKTLKSKVRVVK